MPQVRTTFFPTVLNAKSAFPQRSWTCNSEHKCGSAVAVFSTQDLHGLKLLEVFGESVFSPVEVLMTE